MPLVFPYSFSGGVVSDPTQVNANFAAVGTYLDVTKLTTANLQTPYAQFSIPFQVNGTFAGGASKSFWLRVPASQIWVGVEATVAFDSVGGGSPVVELQGVATYGGTPTNLLTAACSESVAQTMTPRTGFVSASYLAGTVFEITLSNSGGGGDNAVDVFGLVTFKVLLRS